MALIVQKYGGTSIATVERIRNVAYKIADEVKNENRVAVVVSAMAGVTNGLISLVNDCVEHVTSPQEYDVVVATGEQVTAGLLALTLQSMGIRARSWLGWQLPIVTDSIHKKAKITDINAAPLLDCEVAVVAGFQGRSADNRITTLGRGGSDATAVALAHYLRAERCDIFTDVDGVFTVDPRLVSDARKIDHLNFDEMLEFSSQGAKVLQAQSVLLAKQYNIPIHILSSLASTTGTLVSKANETYRPSGIIGIANDKNCTLIKLEKDKLNHSVFNNYLNEHNIYLNQFDNDLIVRHEDLETIQAFIKTEKLTPTAMFDKVAKISLVGNRMNEFADIINKKVGLVFDEFGINGHGTYATPQSLSIVASSGHSEDLVRALHKVFNLGKIGLSNG